MATLNGRVALVTGSTSGIGLGIAQALAAEGADIVLHGLGSPDAIAAARRQVEAAGVRVALSDADVADPAAIRRMAAEAAEAFGRVDILVNNAGIQHTAPIADFPDDRWDAVIAINLSAAFHTIKALSPAMREAGWGRIVNVASAHGLVASASKAAYVAAKHGLLGLTKVAAIELADAGVTVNAICPGWVLTPLVQAQLDERARRSGRTVREEEVALLREKQPMAAFTTPAQIGAMAAYLCSDAAATITGVPMSIDGGWTAQ